MEVFVWIAIAAVVLLLAELLLPTGGALAALGAIGLIGAGVVALGSDSGSADVAGAGLITAGVLAAITFYLVAGKVVEAHRNRAVKTGSEELVGAVAEARSTIDPDGQVWLEGALWGARLAAGRAPARHGDRVRVQAVEGLTLVVAPEPQAAETPSQGGSS
ncbi:MAG: NfeD family protein [Solirubrobacterales bacterium]